MPVFSFFIYLGFSSVTAPEKENKKRLIELKKYNVENAKNLGKNIEILNQEFEFLDNKNERLILNHAISKIT